MENRTAMKGRVHGVRIRDDQAERLRALARTSDMTMGALIRRGIDMLLASRQRNRRAA